MVKIRYTEPKEEREAEVVPFKPRPILKIIQGGKAGGNPPGKYKDWLSELEKGTVFLVEEQNSNEHVQTWFKVAWRSENKRENSDSLASVRLFTIGIENKEIYFFTNPIRFCNKHSLVEVLSVEREENE